jgi:hypothetical protein
VRGRTCLPVSNGRTGPIDPPDADDPVAWIWVQLEPEAQGPGDKKKRGALLKANGSMIKSSGALCPCPQVPAGCSAVGARATRLPSRRGSSSLLAPAPCW